MLAILLLLSSLITSATVHTDQAFEGHTGAFVLVDALNHETFVSNPKAVLKKYAPCSTFKIWNSAIALETGLVTDPDAPFWKWDGTKRFLEAWNQDQTLRSAISVSCVPAYQNLARKIGRERMQHWLDEINYGDRNISSGIDVFWLPHPPDRKTLLISPVEQANLLVELINGRLPFSSRTLTTLKDILKLKTTSRGTLYGKTGTGTDEEGNYNLGWFVGFVESDGKIYTFACVLEGAGISSKEARVLAEKLLGEFGLL